MEEVHVSLPVGLRPPGIFLSRFHFFSFLSFVGELVFLLLNYTLLSNSPKQKTNKEKKENEIATQLPAG
jgi:hypothetical protein